MSLYLALGSGSPVCDLVLGCVEERWLAAWLVKHTKQGVCCPCCCVLCHCPTWGPCPISGWGGVSLLSMLNSSALLSCSTAQGPVVPALSSDPPPLFAPSPEHPRAGVSVPCPQFCLYIRCWAFSRLQALTAAFALSQALGRNSPFTLHVSWRAVSPADQVSQPPRGALPSDTSLGYSMCKSGPGLSHVRAGKE